MRSGFDGDLAKEQQIKPTTVHFNGYGQLVIFVTNLSRLESGVGIAHTSITLSHLTDGVRTL